MRSLLCAVALLLAGPAVAAAQVDRTISSGPLTATVTAEPWNVAFADANGRAVLTEAQQVATLRRPSGSKEAGP